MKKSTFYPCLLLLIAASVSCGKDSGGGNNAGHKIIFYTEEITDKGIGNTVEKFTVSYDEKERVTSIESTTRPGHKMVYQYAADNSFTFDNYDDNKLTYHSINFINSQSLIDSTWWRTIQNKTSSAKFIYNEDKQLVKQRQYLIKDMYPPVLYNTVNYQYDIKGTLVKEADQGNYETSYAYDKELKNTVHLEPFYYPFKEQLPSHTYTIRLGNSTTTKHTYSLDDHNRIASEKAEQSDGRITIRTYTYQ